VSRNNSRSTAWLGVVEAMERLAGSGELQHVASAVMIRARRGRAKRAFAYASFSRRWRFRLRPLSCARP
jgi:hypothetical protein